MSIDVNKNKGDILQAYNDLLNEKTETDWILLGYEGQTNTLKLVGTGDGGLEELAEDLNTSKIMYAVVKLTDPKTTRLKNVLISWSGEGAPNIRKGVCARHVHDVKALFHGINVTVNARSEEEVEVETVMAALGRATATSYDFSDRQEEATRARPVGTNYQRTNPVAEINTSSRNHFWEVQEQEEKSRKEQERERSRLEQEQQEMERKKTEEAGTSLRDAETERRSSVLSEQRRATDAQERRASALSVTREQAEDPNTRQLEQEERSGRPHELARERTREAEHVIGSTQSARSMFEHNSWSVGRSVVRTSDRPAAAPASSRVWPPVGVPASPEEDKIKSASVSQPQANGNSTATKPPPTVSSTLPSAAPLASTLPSTINQPSTLSTTTPHSTFPSSISYSSNSSSSNSYVKQARAQFMAEDTSKPAPKPERSAYSNASVTAQRNGVANGSAVEISATVSRSEHKETNSFTVSQSEQKEIKSFTEAMSEHKEKTSSTIPKSEQKESAFSMAAKSEQKETKPVGTLPTSIGKIQHQTWKVTRVTNTEQSKTLQDSEVTKKDTFSSSTNGSSSSQSSLVSAMEQASLKSKSVTTSADAEQKPSQVHKKQEFFTTQQQEQHPSVKSLINSHSSQKEQQSTFTNQSAQQTQQEVSKSIFVTQSVQNEEFSTTTTQSTIKEESTVAYQSAKEQQHSSKTTETSAPEQQSVNQLTQKEQQSVPFFSTKSTISHNEDMTSNTSHDATFTMDHRYDVVTPDVAVTLPCDVTTPDVVPTSPLLEKTSPLVEETPSIAMTYEIEGVEYQLLPEHGLCARALFDYQAADDTEISFDPPDIVSNIERIDEGWWQGVGPQGGYGLFPANYVELINAAME